MLKKSMRGSGIGLFWVPALSARPVIHANAQTSDNPARDIAVDGHGAGGLFLWLPEK